MSVNTFIEKQEVHTSENLEMASGIRLETDPIDMCERSFMRVTLMQ